jgi:hypothetical protein
MQLDERAESSRPRSFVLAGLALAAASVALAAAAGPPYASLSHLSPWLVAFAIGLFAALFALPFELHDRLEDRLESDARWERALLLWGAAALGLLAIGSLYGAGWGFGADSLIGSLALVAVIEAGLILASLVAWLLSN